MYKLILILLSLSFAGNTSAAKKPDYTNAKLPTEQRVKDLMSRMTLEEKVAQMCQYVGISHMIGAQQALTLQELETSDASGFYPGYTVERIREMTRKGLIGSFLHVVTAEEANYLQQLARQSRLKIPLFIAIDAMHGNGLYRGATVYPTPIGQAATFSPSLIERMSRQTAVELRACGVQWAFAPNVEIARDPRWGRVGETFGEDPYLSGCMGSATVRGLQTSKLQGQDKVLACMKHFVGGSLTTNGINGSPADMSERMLREVFLPSFIKCIDAGVMSLMPSHNDLSGIPCHGNRWLLNDLLRKELGFKGIIVSDWLDVERMSTLHTVVSTKEEAYLMGQAAGIDVHMHGPGFGECVIKAVEEGKINPKNIDDRVAEILKLKFDLGLFEQPFVDIKAIPKAVLTAEHRQTALDMARRSIVLLKNENQMLPLRRGRFSRIFITGHNADNQSTLGDWSFEQPEENVITVLEGIKAQEPNAQIDYLDVGRNVRSLTKPQIEEAVKRAKASELAILVVGENSMRYHWKEKTCGENSDRYELSLPGMQQQLVEAVVATGVPTIVILVNGRPLSTEWIADNVPAIVEAWEPGLLGGQALAEILYGKVSPSAKLPITIPRNAGQIGCYYNHKKSAYRFPYATGTTAPLYAFGYGLSYTTFRYSRPRLSTSAISVGDSARVSVDVTNTGTIDAEEVVQLYIRDDYSSATRPVKELKGFERIALKAGETKTVTFLITPESLSYYDAAMKYGVEPGTFTLMVGSSSRKEDLQSLRLTVGTNATVASSAQ